MLHLRNESPNQEKGLIYMSDEVYEGEGFLAAYSGEILGVRDLLTHPDTKVNDYTIELLPDDDETKPTRYLSRQWRLSGWCPKGKEHLAIYANHQIIGDTQKRRLSDIIPRDELQGLQRLEATTPKQNTEIRDKLLRILGTHDVSFFPIESKPNQRMLNADYVPRHASTNNLHIAKDYYVVVNYPANAELVRMNPIRTFILSNGTQEGTIDILDHADNNRIFHWDGTICCSVMFIDTKPGAEIHPGDEITVSYGTEYANNNGVYRLDRKVAYYPADRPFLVPFELRDKENKAYADKKLVEILIDAVSVVLHTNSSNLTANFIIQRFITKYDLRVADPQKALVRLLNEVLPDSDLPQWLDDEAQEIEGNLDTPILLQGFVSLIHSLAKYIQADDMDRLVKALYRVAFIHFVPGDKVIAKVNATLAKLRKRRSARSRALLQEEENQSFSDDLVEEEDELDIQNYFLIPLLGESNLVYRDSLYYMMHQNTAFHESRREYNTKMYIYEGTREAFTELVLPVTRYLNEQRVLDKQTTIDALLTETLGIKENSIAQLKMTFIFYLGLFMEKNRYSDFLSLTYAYLRLFALIRLLPVTQLEDRWLDRLYGRYRVLYVEVAMKNTIVYTKKNTQTTPTDSFDYAKEKAKWYNTPVLLQRRY